ncbi:MAG: hypothetical protein KF773_04045 [Deltaproteobacteria bacterium]|nr:hypothetical protein [Deltaproteobacteria bacterium]
MALASLLVLGACSVGEVPIGGGNPDANNSAGAASFQSMIVPLVTECIGCHGAATPPNLTSFDTLAAKYKTGPGASNILVTKGTLGIPSGTHQGINYFTTEEQAIVAAWIDSL